MVSSLIFLSTIEPYAFWGLFLVGMAAFVIYSILLEKKTNLYRRLKSKNRCKAEKTKYYD